ncbi:MAG: glycosyltransferase family 2 protein [Proteobacteria bacterium]|nr:glycosyltransferase family 2 protein [Pseudomonadota bacterium]MBU2226619.1 glycosyltransferase family 2 protein [Pseudomonadota bacterium]MBU2261798.1 glycosyltransferase family 2 protein [Pseudomonadota bacterium]
MNLPDVSIIIVNYNTADLIGACLESIGPQTAPSREVFVVDNASTDGSAEIVRNRYPWVHLTVNKENRGFAAANNQVLPLCRGRYLYYLNPDAKLTASGLIAECIRFMDAHPQVGLAGTRLINPDGSLQESVSWRYPGQKFAMSEMEGLKGEIACVLGASMIARTDLIRRIGGFDEDFILYGEDQDICLRIRRAGYEIGYVDSVAVVHFGGRSERQSFPAEVWKKKTRAEYLFYRKHYLPETIARIRKADLIKTRFRLVTLTLTMPFLCDRAGAEGKRTKYRAVYETLKQMNGEGGR